MNTITLSIHKGPHSYIKLMRLKNKSFVVYAETNGKTSQSFFTKIEEQQAKDFFKQLSDINY